VKVAHPVAIPALARVFTARVSRLVRPRSSRASISSRGEKRS